MVSDLDIYRSARILVEIHGDTADVHAALKVDEMAEKNDAAGLATWKRILVAVDDPLNVRFRGKSRL